MKVRRFPLIAVLDGSVAVTGALNSAILAAQLLSENARTLLILPEGSAVSRKDLPDEIELAFIPLPMMRKSVGSLLAYGPRVIHSTWRLRRLLSALNIDILQVNDFYLLPGFLVRPLGWRGRIIGKIRIDTRRFGLPGRVWLYAAKRWSDSLAAVSHFIADAIGGKPPIRVLYNPIAIRATDEELVGLRPPRLVFISNYIRGKGQDSAIRAFHVITARFPAAELHFYGGDMGLQKNRDYRHELEGLAAGGPASERIRFHDFDPDTKTILGQARAALTLSHSESFSLTCQEASARGVPVIATRCGGPSEIIEDEVTGYLVEVGDEAAVADRMARLLADPELARDMGRRGAALMVERFSPERWLREKRLLLGFAEDDPQFP